MSGRWLHALALLGCVVLAGACAIEREGRFDEAWFPRAASVPDSAPSGPIALVVGPSVQGLVVAGRKGAAEGVRFPLGRIVEEALAQSLAQALRGGVQREGAALPAGARPAATLVVDAARIEHGSRTKGIVPWPAFPFVMPLVDTLSTLAFDLRLVDAQGTTLWSRSYDSGPEVAERKSFWSVEAPHELLLRTAHEQAWRLSQQAATDVREALASERNKARDL